MTSTQRESLQKLAGWFQYTGANGFRDDIRDTIDEIDRLTKERAVLAAGITAVSNLVDDSFGVAGLHQNGDLAPWTELESGGRFEEWLIDFDKARDLLASNQEAAMPEEDQE